MEPLGSGMPNLTANTLAPETAVLVDLCLEGWDTWSLRSLYM